MFNQLKSIFVLVLCMSFSLESHAVSDICSICKCENSKTKIDCSSRGLTSVPQPIPPKVVSFNLDNNNITETKAETFRNLSSLETLDLGRNNLKDIQAGTFKDLPSLAILILWYNDIQEMKAETFQNVPRLTILELGSNNLKDIKAGPFKNLPSLTTLSLWSNAIEEINAESFRNLASLSTLNLRDNTITEIKPDTFRNLSSLTHLNLGGNKIKEIKAGIFQSLTRLIYLSLWGNDIKEIKAETFRNLSSLTHIFLRKNRIQNYEDGTFLFLPSLTKIDLKENNDMMCGCHLPALVNYMNRTLNISLNVMGECRTDSDNNQSKIIPIMEYSQCENYSLFQRNLQCQTCSRMTCSASEVTSCPEAEPVCHSGLSMNGDTLKFEKSCSTYRKCLEAIKNNILTCNKWTSGTSCVACCTGNLCNKNNFTGSNNFVFHLIFNSISKKFNEDIFRGMEHELSNLTGTFRVAYCGSEKNSEVFTITCTVPRTITKDQIFKQVFESFKTSQILRDLGIQQRNMELLDEILCRKNMTTSNGTFYWPMTKVGTNATIPCHANVATRYCSSRQAVHSEMPPKCSPFTGVWKEPDMSQCYNTERITQQLKNITSEDIDKENVEKVSTILLNISKKSEYFKAEDIDLAVDIHEKMVPLISNVSANITVNNILLSINDMINTPEEILVEAEKSKRTGNRMLDILEAIPEKIPLKDQQLTALYSNVGIGITKVEEHSFNGLFFGVLYGNNETEAKAMIYNNTYAKTPQEETKHMDFISLPSSLIKHLKDEGLSTMSRISFVFMRDDKIQRVVQKSSTETNTTIKSQIIAANVPNITITNLDEPVTISFNVKDQAANKLRCVYWDNIVGNWSGEGCKRTGNVPGEKVFCSCNHLTSFAIILDVSENGKGPNDEILSILSNIGCGISLVCLILTMIIHVSSKTLRKLMVSKILVNLCISLAFTNFIFLVGMQPYASKITGVCKAVAALLHYFLLASLMWMAVEALHVFLGLVVVFRTYETSFMTRSSILAWGLPAIVVIITLAINYTNNYIRIAQVCWLSKVPFYAAFLAPVVIILLFNIIIFVVVIWRLISIRKDNMFEHETRKLRVWGVVGLIFLFGLSWVLAFFTFGDTTKVFKFLFIIFNTLQGCFIFIFYCLYKKDTRDIICPCIRNKKRNKYGSVVNKNRYSGNEMQEEIL